LFQRSEPSSTIQAYALGMKHLGGFYVR